MLGIACVTKPACQASGTQWRWQISTLLMRIGNSLFWNSESHWFRFSKPWSKKKGVRKKYSESALKIKKKQYQHFMTIWPTTEQIKGTFLFNLTLARPPNLQTLKMLEQVLATPVYSSCFNVNTHICEAWWCPKIKIIYVPNSDNCNVFAIYVGKKGSLKAKTLNIWATPLSAFFNRRREDGNRNSLHTELLDMRLYLFFLKMLWNFTGKQDLVYVCSCKALG